MSPLELFLLKGLAWHTIAQWAIQDRVVIYNTNVYRKRVLQSWAYSEVLEPLRICHFSKRWNFGEMGLIKFIALKALT